MTGCGAKTGGVTLIVVVVTGVEEAVVVTGGEEVVVEPGEVEGEEVVVDVTGVELVDVDCVVVEVDVCEVEGKEVVVDVVGVKVVELLTVEEVDRDVAVVVVDLDDEEQATIEERAIIKVVATRTSQPVCDTLLFIFIIPFST